MIDQSRAYVTALTGDVNTVMHWRAIHDKDRGAQPRVLHGTIDQCYSELQALNLSGYGIFCAVNALDGRGYGMQNVSYIRSHLIDLDDPVLAGDALARATSDGATFAVNSSENKYHVYWTVQPYSDTTIYDTMQRKLVQVYGGDHKVVDATRVMRVAGFYHVKGNPYMVQCWGLSNYRFTLDQLQQRYAGVNVISHVGNRVALGDKELAAPSLDYLKAALKMIDPNSLGHDEWVSTCAAFKQAGWTLANEAELLAIWQEWCALYASNDPAESLKKWNSIRDTEVGWGAFTRKTTINAYIQFGAQPPAFKTPIEAPQVVSRADIEGEILDASECARYFEGCYFVEQSGRIFTPSGRFMNSSQFNGAYGGKIFINTSNGKTTDEAWKAALRSTVYTIPKIDHVRFVPDQPRGAVIIDSMERKGINTYIPARIDARPCDISRWIQWLEKALPVAEDRRILIEYLAHSVKYVGYKIPWAPMLQSAEGIGKTIFCEIMKHCVGEMYVYQPQAKELVDSGSKFNAWMRNKLMIVVDEIRVDERRDLIEVLKPMLTEKRIQIQAKGADQDMEDNAANWLFFSNYKDAVPIGQNGRRYCIFYSALQTARDIEAAGFGGNYFPDLFNWLRNEGGLAGIAHYLLNYPIECGQIAQRAPQTSSYVEAIKISRSPMENIIADCVTDGVCGFRGGYVSTLAVIARCKANGLRTASANGVRQCLENMGFVLLGRARTAYAQEDINIRTEIYADTSALPIELYGRAQGYE